MESFISETLRTKVDGEFDVIVAGGGPAGIGAAVGAARNGMKVLLIDENGCVGGMWTCGLVNPIFENKEKSGILKEIIDKLKENNAWGGFGNSCFQYEIMKTVLDDLLTGSGVLPLFHTRAVKAITENGIVKGVVVENRAGRAAYFAKTVIDCTGDAAVAVSAGAEFLLGRLSDSLMQPMTLMFVIGNVNFKQNNREHLYSLLKKAVEENNLPYTIPYNFPWIINLPNSKNAVVQLTHLRNCTSMSAFELSAAEIEARKQIADTVRVMKTYIEELKDIELLYSAPQMGVRETRRVVGDYILQAEDMMEGKTFEDGIATSGFNIDIHNPDDYGHVITKVKRYEIPYRCLIPKGLEGILVAGRCISGTHEALASYRVTGVCIFMGQAAGTAAALAVKGNIKLRDVSIQKLKSLLPAER